MNVALRLLKKLELRMAPNRRKSKASSVAAADAVQKKWKVGDLVLAKVKGFPVWPATVSEPEKWGYKPDSKKVLVFFFGTNQIAFCSHADVEAFTDEKKQSVQGKRYGKSADFVRAVNEIIESYDKLKTQAQDHDLNCGVEAAVTNGENSVGSLVNPGTTDPMSNDSEPLIHQLHNGSVSTMDKFEGSPPFDDAASVMDENRNSSYIISISGTPVGRSHVLRKKHGAVNSLANVNQRSFPSTGRSRTSRANASRQQDNELPSVDSVAGTGNIVLCRGSPRDANTGMSTLGDEKLVDSPLLVPNSSPEDSTSGIASQECNSNNMTEGSSFNSSCLPEQTGTAGNLNENVGLTKRHGLDIKAVFVKKKRKPNRKRFATDSQELTSSVDNADLIIGVHNYRLNSPNACEKSNESPSKVDCDEYLPLVKRARVRMGKLSDVGGHVDALMVDVKEKSTNGCHLDVSNGLSMNSFNKHSSNEQDVIMMKEPTGDPLTQPDSSILANGDQPDNLCKGSPCDKEDGEGGLPPSVHVHSAFETISVNVTKDYQPHVEGQICNSLAVIAGSISSLAEAGATVTGSDVGEDMLGANVNAACNNEIEVKLLNDTAVANPLRPSESKIPLIESAETNQCTGSSSTMEEARISDAGHKTSGVNCLPLDTKEQNDSFVKNQFSGDQFLHYYEKKNSDSSQGIDEPPDHKLSSSDNTEMGKCVVRKDDDDASKITFKTDPAMCSEDGIIQTEILQLPLEEKMPAHIMSAFGGDLTVDLCLKPGTSIEVMEIQNDSSQLASASYECSSEKVVLGVQTCPSSINSPMLPYLPASSCLPISSIQNCSNPQNNYIFCPSNKLLVKREEGTVYAGVTRYGTMGSSGKVTNYVEAKASLTSFGNALRTLTRTKDSIGRATRVAIEFAKAGLAAKVVDILTRTLENESSLNRKVDLFFLVDSMMQCSRGLKGEVGGIYPSEIQAALPRLLSAAAPAGNAAIENRRQCLKVLKLWLERRILPDSVVRHHMRNLDFFSIGSYSSGPFSRRSSRTERAFHDPLTEMEGMVVDEYGSNSSIQLSGFCMPRMRKDDSRGSDSDGESFEAITPEHNSGTPEEPERYTGERHRHILEGVDGELEMEDVTPSEAELNSANDVGGISNHISNEEAMVTSLAPPLPNGVPPSSPPLPTSPPPPNVHPPHLPPLHVPHQNQSIPSPPIHPPPVIHSLSAPHTVCPPHGHSQPLSSAHSVPLHPSVRPLPPSAAVCPPPVYLPVAVHPSTDMVVNGADLVVFGCKNNSVDNLPPGTPLARQTYGDSMEFRSSDRHGTQRQMGVPEPLTSCSFDSFSGPRHAARSTNSSSVQPSNSVRHSDYLNYDSRGYNARPPPLGPPNNFPSVQGDHRGHHSWREGPPRSYPNNYGRGPIRDDRNHYNDHNWRIPGSQYQYEDRKYYGPPFPGDIGGPYPPHHFVAPYNEHNKGRQGWGYPPR